MQCETCPFMRKEKEQLICWKYLERQDDIKEKIYHVIGLPCDKAIIICNVKENN